MTFLKLYDTLLIEPYTIAVNKTVSRWHLFEFMLSESTQHEWCRQWLKKKLSIHLRLPESLLSALDGNTLCGTLDEAIETRLLNVFKSHNITVLRIKINQNKPYYNTIFLKRLFWILMICAGIIFVIQLGILNRLYATRNHQHHVYQTILSTQRNNLEEKKTIAQQYNQQIITTFQTHISTPHLFTKRISIHSNKIQLQAMYKKTHETKLLHHLWKKNVKTQHYKVNPINKTWNEVSYTWITPLAQ